MAPLSRLDHVVVAVKNLDTAAATYKKLGFTLTPRGLHEGKGTGNHCIMFGSNYIELLGIVDETGTKGRLAERVNDRGEGGLGIAYGADDADKTYAALRAAGVEAEPPNDLARPLELDGKREMVRFRNIMLPGLALPDTMQFVCTHVTPELTRARHEWQLHPNGGTGIADIIISVQRPGDYLEEFVKLFGSDNGWMSKDANSVFGQMQNSSLTAQINREIQDRFSSKDIPITGMAGLSIRVHEIDAVGAMLDMGRVPYRETEFGVAVPASAAHGVCVEFFEG
jgi:catechol 2,3-dioxygenase-like lactoylglutathione lyase family enzyme